MGDKVVIKTSIWKSLVVILGSWIFVIAAIETWDSGSKIFGITTILFFGVGSLAIVYRVINRSPRLVLDDSGVTDLTTRIGTIAWSDIGSARLVSIFSAKFVALKLRDTEKYLAKLSGTSRRLTRINKSLGFGDLCLNLGLVNMRPKEIFRIVELHISKYPKNEH